MELEVGAILDGKVTGITKFGAFVSLPGGRSGLVHISEIAYSFVNDVNELLSVGQDVKVKLIGIDDSGRINLSIKQTAPPPARPGAGRPRGQRPQRSGESQNRTPPPYRQSQSRGESSFQPRPAAKASQEPQDFDYMLKHFLSDSESRQSDLNRGGESRRPRRNRRG